MRWFIGMVLIVGAGFYMIIKKAPVAPPAEQQAAPTPPPPPPPEPPIQQRLNGKTIETVRGLLIDSNPQVRSAALDLLYNFNDPQAIATMSKILETETDPSVIKEALTLVTRKKDPLGEPILYSALKNYNPDIRLAAVEDLAQYEDANSIPPLTMLMKDNDEKVRLATVNAVQKIQTAVEQRRRKEEEERRRREEEARRKAQGG